MLIIGAMTKRYAEGKLFFILITVSLISTAAIFAVLNQFFRLQIIPCTDSWANNLLLSLILILLVQIFLFSRILPNYWGFLLLGQVILLLSTLWLGLYPISPLGYKDGRIPLVQGFLIIRAGRESTVGRDEVVSLRQGSTVAISPLLLNGDFQCIWMSTKGGELDDPSSCDTVYNPPAAEYDILKLHLRSSCGLPETTSRLKFSILP